MVLFFYFDYEHILARHLEASIGKTKIQNVCIH